MNQETITMEGSSGQPLDALAQALKAAVDGSLVAESRRELAGAVVWLLVFERYYFRVGSYASLTVLLTEAEGRQIAELIGSGGGNGLFNVTWGANTDFAALAAQVLAQYGLQELA